MKWGSSRIHIKSDHDVKPVVVEWHGYAVVAPDYHRWRTKMAGLLIAMPFLFTVVVVLLQLLSLQYGSQHIHPRFFHVLGLSGILVVAAPFLVLGTTLTKLVAVVREDGRIAVCSYGTAVYQPRAVQGLWSGLSSARALIRRVDLRVGGTFQRYTGFALVVRQDYAMESHSKLDTDVHRMAVLMISDSLASLIECADQMLPHTPEVDLESQPLLGGLAMRPRI